MVSAVQGNIGYISGQSINRQSINRTSNGAERNTKVTAGTRFKQGIIAAIISVTIMGALLFVANRVVTGITIGDVPEDIAEFAEKNPEAASFANNYNLYKDMDFDIDVSKDMADGGIPLFIQWDKRWGYRKYGENYIGVAGCGPTCVAMVACGLTGDETINPYVVSKYANDRGYYTDGVGTSWSLMTAGVEHFGITGTEGTISADYILQNLSEETPMICSMKPGDFTSSGHFIVLAGIYSDGTIIVNDPNSNKNSVQHWDVDTLVSQMKGIWIFNN